MEQEEFKNAFAKLDHRESMRRLDLQFGFNREPEEVDTLEVVEVLNGAYAGLALGICENVQAWRAKNGPLLQKVVTPTVYINGEVAQTKTEFLLSPYRSLNNEETQPEYVETYIKSRDAAYAELLQYAVDNNDFEPLLSTITTYKESVLAKRLLRELHGRKESYPHAIAGDARRVLAMIDNTNHRVDTVRHSSQEYAIKVAQREYGYRLRRRLNDNETGILKAVALGIKIKFGRPVSKRKWVQLVIEDQLREIAQYPTVPEQLIDKEKQGLVLNETELSE